MLIWRGMGPIGIIIPGAAGVGGYFLLQWLGLGVMGVGIGIILGSLLTRWLARKIDELEPGEAGGLYYIPLRSWCLVSGAVHAVSALAVGASHRNRTRRCRRGRHHRRAHPAAVATGRPGHARTSPCSPRPASRA
jgi:predicted lysophospholipase L1 biosynthesis ABC-type transport system permease subunit